MTSRHLTRALSQVFNTHASSSVSTSPILPEPSMPPVSPQPDNILDALLARRGDEMADRSR